MVLFLVDLNVDQNRTWLWHWQQKLIFHLPVTCSKTCLPYTQWSLHLVVMQHKKTPAKIDTAISLWLQRNNFYSAVDWPWSVLLWNKPFCFVFVEPRPKDSTLLWSLSGCHKSKRSVFSCASSQIEHFMSEDPTSHHQTKESQKVEKKPLSFVQYLIIFASV